MTKHSGSRRFTKKLHPFSFVSGIQLEKAVDYERFLQKLEIIRQSRKEKGMTQEILSEVADLSPKHLSVLEKGKTNPTICLLLKVANALKVEIADLLFGCQDSSAEQILCRQIMELLRKLKQPELKKVKQIVKVMAENDE